MKTIFPTFIITSLVLVSCATSNSIVHDDIYSVKASELPIGESTADEVSYASFKSRKQGNVNDRMTYSDEVALVNRQNCLDQWRWFDGCGCSYNEWLRSSIHSPHNRMNSFSRMGFMITNHHPNYTTFGSYHPSIGYWGYSSFNMYPYMSSSYMMYNQWYGNGMYYPYGGGMGYGHGGFGMGFSPYGYGMGYLPYGYGAGYGYGGNMNGWSNTGNQSSVNNTIRGPRGTSASGTYNPSGRTYSSATVKSGKINSSGNLAPNHTRANSTVREVAPRDVLSRTNANSPNRTIDNSSRVVESNRTLDNSRMNTTSNSSSTRTSERMNENSNSRATTNRASSNYEGNYPSRNSTSPSSNVRMNTNVNRTNTNSGGFERSTSSPSMNTNRGTSISSSPSRSSVGSSSSGGANRSSGGGSGSSGGRR